MISIVIIFYKVPLIKDNTKFINNSLKISIIIPARNEEKRLPNLLETLKKQSFKDFELIVVDDNSKDKTSQFAIDFGAKVLNLSELPKGWTGKTWACWNGALSADGDILIFLDADTKIYDNGLEKIIYEFITNYKEGALSIQPYHMVNKLYENFSVIFNMVVMIGMNTFSLIKSKPSGSFGPCLVISKNTYLKIGGHKSVNTEILEDIAIGKNIIKHNLPLGCLGGKGTISFRMYPDGILDLISGWSKNFASGAKNTSKFINILLSTWFLGAILIIFLITIATFLKSYFYLSLVIILYLIYNIIFLIKAKSIGNFNTLFLLLFPIPLLFFLIVFIRSIILTKYRHSVDWKGRKIDV